ncbi:MAG: hypothetical protein RSC60_03270 [Christensenellaceae bacterium]
MNDLYHAKGNYEKALKTAYFAFWLSKKELIQHSFSKSPYHYQLSISDSNDTVFKKTLFQVHWFESGMLMSLKRSSAVTSLLWSCDAHKQATTINKRI